MEKSVDSPGKAVSSDFPSDRAHEISVKSSDVSGLENHNQTIISEEVEQLEAHLAEENAKEEDELQKQIAERLAEEKAIQEQRHKRLMHLLSKSQFYSQFLLQKIKDHKNMGSSERKKHKRSQDVPGKTNFNTGKENSVTSGSSTGICEQVERVTRRGRRMEQEPLKITNKKHIREPRQPKKKWKPDEAFIEDIDEKTVIATMQNNTKEDNEMVRGDQPVLFEGGTMRDYQLDGFSWLKVLFENGINGILADEMGLGKTIQCIALMCHLVMMGVPGPFLIVAPLSTLPNWISEFNRFAPKIPVLLYHGNENTRREKQKEIGKRSIVRCEEERHVAPVVVTSYEVAIKDKFHLCDLRWKYIVIDEGHRLKNFKCQLVRSLKMYRTTNRLILTGTPLQNNLSELWSLLNFLLPEIFDSLDVFESWFDISSMMAADADEKIIQQEREQQIISTLRKILSPFLLRRVKTDVEVVIPPKKELLVYTPMTELQLELYKATVTRDFSAFESLKKPRETVEYDEKGRPKRKAKNNISFLALFSSSESDASLQQYFNLIAQLRDKFETKKAVSSPSRVAMSLKMQNIMMQCRKIVNHPYLVCYPVAEDGTCKITEDILKVCGKLQVLDQLLSELKKQGHKVLLFSQMTKMLDIIEDYLSLRPWFQYKRLDGSVRLEDRTSDIAEFNRNEDCFLYLLSTRAGGLGINLTSADTVIIYDSDWNPQQDLQAQDRCHRIGQTKPVLILRLVTANTVDQYVLERAVAKRKLEKMIIKSGKFKSALSEDDCGIEVDSNELLNLLNHRDHQKIHRTSTGNVFTKEELSSILDRSDLIGKLTHSCEQMEGVFRIVPHEDDLKTSRERAVSTA